MKRPGAIGIDVGGTKTLFALFDQDFGLIEEIQSKTRADKGRAHFTQNLEDSVHALLRRAKKQGLGVRAVGIGCAGRADSRRGTMKESPNIPFLRGYRFRSILSGLTDAGVTLTNDLHAGVYGEQQLGAAIGKKHVICIFMGTGIGGAAIVDGRLLLGASGDAGNIGNYLIHPAGLHATSPREGTLDAISSRTAIAGEAATLALKQWAPNLLRDAGTDVRHIKAGDLASSIKKGDRAIEELVRSRARLVGIALSNLVDFLNPEIIILGGGLVDAMPQLIRQEVQGEIDRNATGAARKVLQVVTSKLQGHAITAGAAKLAVEAVTDD